MLTSVMTVLNKSAIVEFLALKLTKISLGTNTLKIRDFVDRETLFSIYNALIRPHFDYCSEVYGIHLVSGSPADFKNCRIELQE